MKTKQKFDANAEINKVQQLLAKNMDEFRFLVLSNMRLNKKNKISVEPLRLDVNRISDFQENTPETTVSIKTSNTTETLEEWVSKEFAPKVDKTEEMPEQLSGETLEEWVGKLKVRPKTRRTGTLMDLIEEWLMNEARKDLFVEMDAIYGSPERLSSKHVRALGENLISLADKLDNIK